MLLLKAKPLLEKRNAEQIARAESLAKKLGRPVHLAVVLVGEDSASKIYVSHKEKACKKIGIKSSVYKFASDIRVEEVYQKVCELNDESSVDGILIQQPLPKQFNSLPITQWVDPKKDVDCFHPENVGLLTTGVPRFYPCTPKAVIDLLDFYQIEISGKIVCVVGRSLIVGKPLGTLLIDRDATLIQCHSKTPNVPDLAKRADIVVSAVGKAKLVTAEWLKQGCSVVDVGINRREDASLCGDVDFDDVRSKVGAITPVPGGVGPLTISTLLGNTLLAAEL